MLHILPCNINKVKMCVYNKCHYNSVPKTMSYLQSKVRAHKCAKLLQ